MTAYGKLLRIWQKYTALWNSVKQWFWVIFCQTLMSFCHTSLNFCQTLVVTLTVCCSVKVCSFVWQNNYSIWQKSCKELGLFDRKSSPTLGHFWVFCPPTSRLYQFILYTVTNGSGSGWVSFPLIQVLLSDQSMPRTRIMLHIPSKKYFHRRKCIIHNRKVQQIHIFRKENQRSRHDVLLIFGTTSCCLMVKIFGNN